MMKRELPVSTDQEKITACVKRITKAISKERPDVVAAACLMILEFSVEHTKVAPEEPIG